MNKLENLIVSIFIIALVLAMSTDIVTWSFTGQLPERSGNYVTRMIDFVVSLAGRLVAFGLLAVLWFVAAVINMILKLVNDKISFEPVSTQDLIDILRE